MSERDTHRYHYKKGNKIVHRGITNDPKRREGEHRRLYGDGALHTVGPKVRRDSGLKWERDGGKRPYRRRRNRSRRFLI